MITAVVPVQRVNVNFQNRDQYSITEIDQFVTCQTSVDNESCVLEVDMKVYHP